MALSANGVTFSRMVGSLKRGTHFSNSIVSLTTYKANASKPRLCFYSVRFVRCVRSVANGNSLTLVYDSKPATGIAANPHTTCHGWEILFANS